MTKINIDLIYYYNEAATKTPTEPAHPIEGFKFPKGTFSCLSYKY